MTQDELKRAAARAAIAEVQGGLVGVGTGTTANFFIEELAQLRERITGAVASSEASAARLTAAGIRVVELNDLEEGEELPIYVDGADEINAGLEMIKGGGAALTREKIVAAAAKRFVCVADESKLVATLGRFPLPVEVIPMARSLVARQLAALGGKPIWRRGVVTDNGNHILDVHGLSITEPTALELAIQQITGVVMVGLFARRPADLLLLSGQAGVKVVRR